jgi:AcrR family transcriptional regulator
VSKPNENARVRIAGAAVGAARERGLSGLTVADAARSAGVSSALVHYHFDTKPALIVAIAERSAADDADALIGALGHGRGLETLDRLWEVLVGGVGSGAARLRAELLLRATRDADVAAAIARSGAAVREALARRLPALMAELGGSLPGPAEEMAANIAALFDGLALTLIAGAAVPDVRTAWDAFWLTLLSAGQGARRR